MTPLIDHIPADTMTIEVRPCFGNQLRVAFIKTTHGMSTLDGTISGITIHGDGRIEYLHEAEAAVPLPAAEDGA